MLEKKVDDVDIQPQRSIKVPYFRILFIVSIIAGVLVFNQFFKPGSSKPKVLGEETKATSFESFTVKIQEDAKNTVDQTLKQIEGSVNELLNQGTQLAVDTASKSAGAVTDVIFQGTIGNLIKQVNKLPEKQRDEVRKEICK